MTVGSERISRRTLLKLAAAAACGCIARGAPSLGRLRVAMLHLEPELGELDRNTRLCEAALEAAARAGADWIVTPELGLTGYRFDRKIGTDWIPIGPDARVERMRAAAARLGITLFLGHLERDPSGRCYNTVFVIGPNGSILGRHHKINTIPVAETWSTPGTAANPVQVGSRAAGVLICADAWPPDHARSLAAQGANVLVSSATWAPGQDGPEDCWERRSAETGLPVFVCNRTGVEGDFDIRGAESVVSAGGRRLVSHVSEHSSVLLVEWDGERSGVTDSRIVAITG